MSHQIPLGPSDRYCPHWRKKMSAVCHTCPMWTLVQGKNPQTGDDLNRWDCAMALLPMLMIEQSKVARGTQSATESMRNDIVKRMDTQPALSAQPVQLRLMGRDDV